MIKFNGKRWADSELEILTEKVNILKRDYNITPHLVSILIGDNKASKFYTNLKLKKAKQVGAKFTIKIFEEDEKLINILEFINNSNENDSVHGIMIQMPIPGGLSSHKQDLINAILPNKDVDGLKIKSDYVHPTAQAIYQILTQVLTTSNKTNILLIGNKGMVGTSLSMLMRSESINFTGIDIDDDLIRHTKNADIIISATGHPNLITAELIKNNVNIIDVGYPKGDVDVSSVSKKAKFITPVPGGVGPVTISLLFNNLIKSAESFAQKNSPQE